MKTSDFVKLQFVRGTKSGIDIEKTGTGCESNNPKEANLQQPGTATQKRPYSKPTLTVYGTIRDLTRAVNNMGADDNGTIPRNKTGFA
jgi:hypothetical protein